MIAATTAKNLKIKSASIAKWLGTERLGFEA